MLRICRRCGAPISLPECGQCCRDILHQLGIGLPQEGGHAEQAEGHRVLVFAQLRGMLDLVARDVLQPLGVPHLRIDGGYAPASDVDLGGMREIQPSGYSIDSSQSKWKALEQG